MKFTSMIALGATLGLAAPGLALAASCEPPTPPAAVDGTKATQDQMLAAKAEVTKFMAASDDYQKCVGDDFDAQKAAAAAAKTKLDPALAKAADDKIRKNQADKEHVGADFNAAVKAYRAAHAS